MLATGLAINCPSAVRYPRGNAEGVRVTSPIKPLEVGKGELLREGKDILFVAIGICANTALSAAELLESQGIDASVIDARFVKPLDKELISQWAQRTGNVITVEENVTAGGFGSAVAEMLEEVGLNVRMRRIGVPDMFIEHGEPEELRSMLGLTAENLAQTAVEMIGTKKPELRSIRL
jgi:1-deoxy-D-xylulose-5-phosphate synthase